MATISGVTIYLDAVFIYGQTKAYTVSIKVKNDNETSFVPLDLSNYFVRFRVLGSPEFDAEVLVEHLITQNTDYETYGQIYEPSSGEFSFALTDEETKKLGKGNFPCDISLMTADDEALFVQSLTEGSQGKEFSKIRIVQV